MNRDAVYNTFYSMLSRYLEHEFVQVCTLVAATKLKIEKIKMIYCRCLAFGDPLSSIPVCAT